MRRPLGPSPRKLPSLAAKARRYPRRRALSIRLRRGERTARIAGLRLNIVPPSPRRYPSFPTGK